MVSVRSLFDEGCKMLTKADIENPAFECSLLAEKHFGASSYNLVIKDITTDEKTKSKFLKDIRKRAKHYPLQYILGIWEFMSLEFKVNPDVLIPRADTETVVVSAIKLFKDKENIVFADIGTGCGAIAVSLAVYLNNSRGYAIDVSSPACKTAKHNAKKNGVADKLKIINHDILNGFDIFKEKLDLIISNPPYVKSGVIKTLSQEVRCEPDIALNGGGDGLLFYKSIIPNAFTALKKGGYLCLEVGYDQYDEVALMLEENKYKDINIAYDLNKIKRAITAVKP